MTTGTITIKWTRWRHEKGRQYQASTVTWERIDFKFRRQQKSINIMRFNHKQLSDIHTHTHGDHHHWKIYKTKRNHRWNSAIRSIKFIIQYCRSETLWTILLRACVCVCVLLVIDWNCRRIILLHCDDDEIFQQQLSINLLMHVCAWCACVCGCVLIFIGLIESFDVDRKKEKKRKNQVKCR